MNPNRIRDQRFTIPISSTGSVDVKIHVPALRAQGLDLTPWAASHVLASRLHTLAVDPPPRPSNEQAIPILELGAGIGLVGIVGSLIWHREAVVTDLEAIVPGITANIDLNHELLVKHDGSAVAGLLDWDQPQRLVLQDGAPLDADHSKAGIILAADTIYDENHPGMLAKTILKWLSPSRTSRVILTFPLRVAYLEHLNELWTLLERGGLEAIQSGQEEATEMEGASWDDERLCEWSVWKWKIPPDENKENVIAPAV